MNLLGTSFNSVHRLKAFIFLPPILVITLETTFVIKYFQTIDIGEDVRNSQRRCLGEEKDGLAGEAPTLGQGFLTLAACWKHSRF